MWKLVYGSARGTSHARSEAPCQDHCTGVVTSSLLVAACSDGAGSAELSHLGSRLAADRFLEEAARWTSESAPPRDVVESWMTLAREGVLAEAEAHGAAPRQFACTILAALVSGNWAAFVQVGDGAIVFDGPDGYLFAFWPDTGEYANTTRFLTDDDYRDHLRIDVVERPVSELALLTDGLQMLALDFVATRVHDRFFSPLFRTLRDGPDEEALTQSLLAFMDSKRVNERTDDDKTLLLAIRMHAHAQPSAVTESP